MMTTMQPTHDEPFLRVQELTKYFASRPGLMKKGTGSVRAVDGVSFDLAAGETLGIVGESGCGKSTTGRLLLRLVVATSGTAFFEGRNIMELAGRDLNWFRSRVQMIFQDPYRSLNPRMTVREIIGEPIKVNRLASGRQLASRVDELLEMVGLNSAHGERWPHEFSGGQRQRIGIARALSVRPRLIVCDEPTSALDVSIQAQIANLLLDLQAEFGLSYLFISHDLALVNCIASRVAVMYLGRIVEIADNRSIFKAPRHPYTQALISAVPEINVVDTERIILQGAIPSPVDPPSGCHFHPRCPLAERLGRPARCSTESPILHQTAPGHSVACHFAERLADSSLAPSN